MTNLPLEKLSYNNRLKALEIAIGALSNIENRFHLGGSIEDCPGCIAVVAQSDIMDLFPIEELEKALK